MSDLIDTTEMYLRTIFELEEEGIAPMRAAQMPRLGSVLGRAFPNSPHIPRGPPTQALPLSILMSMRGNCQVSPYFPQRCVFPTRAGSTDSLLY